MADGIDYSNECPCKRHANLTTMKSLTSKGLDTAEWRVIFAKGCITPGDYEKQPHLVRELYKEAEDLAKTIKLYPMRKKIDDGDYVRAVSRLFSREFTQKDADTI